MNHEEQIASLSRQVESLTALLAQALSGTKLPDVTLSRAVVELVEAKRKANRRPIYVKSLKGYLARFTRGRENVQLASIGVPEVEAWVNRYTAQYSRQTQLNRVNVLFSFAERRGWLKENPCRRVERTSIDHRPPFIFGVEQTKTLLRWTVNNKPRCVPYLALALFCGIRPTELQGMTWEAVNLEQGIVTIDATVSKVRSRRIVHMPAVANQERGQHAGLLLCAAGKDWHARPAGTGENRRASSSVRYHDRHHCQQPDELPDGRRHPD